MEFALNLKRRVVGPGLQAHDLRLWARCPHPAAQPISTESGSLGLKPWAFCTCCN